MKEHGFAHTRKQQLCYYVALLMGALATVGLLTCLIGYRSWDDAKNPTSEARELSRWQTIVLAFLCVSSILALGVGRLLARLHVLGTLGLEVLVVSVCACFLITSAIIPKHYFSRLLGYDDAEAIWGVSMGGTDAAILLNIDCVVTGLHLFLPIRWLVLAPIELTAVLAYTLPALLLGSPAMNMVPYNIIALLTLTVLAAVGRRAGERQERRLFAGLLEEKQMRFQAEFQLSKVDRTATQADDLVSERSAAMSRPGTTMSEAAFGVNVEHTSLDQIRAIGLREQWLIGSGEVELLPDRVLGEGGFGIVVSGLYHNTLVAVKAPKEDVVKQDAISSRLPELCNELRILRRIRHPNIAFLYGACMDAASSKLCLVLELVDGLSLCAFIRGLASDPDGPVHPRPGAPETGDPASSASVRSLIVFDVLNVLRYLHSRQPVVVHGDLKDSNVFVEERRGRSGRSSYRAKLLDFGLSRIVTQRARPLGGTLRWMAPDMEIMVESRGGNGRHGARNEESPGAIVPTAVDASSGKKFREFDGVVEVRRDSTVSVGSLVPTGWSSGCLPPVQEHEVMVSGEAHDGSAQEQLAHPGCRPTPLSTQTLTLAYLLTQWNAPVPRGACCWMHGALRSLDRVREKLKSRPCNNCGVQEGMVSGQCDSCGLLVLQSNGLCEFCEVPEASGAMDDSAHSSSSPSPSSFPPSSSCST